MVCACGADKVTKVTKPHYPSWLPSYLTPRNFDTVTHRLITDSVCSLRLTLGLTFSLANLASDMIRSIYSL